MSKFAVHRPRTASHGHFRPSTAIWQDTTAADAFPLWRTPSASRDAPALALLASKLAFHRLPSALSARRAPRASALPRAVASAHGVAAPLQPAGRRPSPAARPSPPRAGLLRAHGALRRPPKTVSRHIATAPSYRHQSPTFCWQCRASAARREPSLGMVRGPALLVRPGRPAGGGAAARRRHSCPPRPPATLASRPFSPLLHPLVSSRPASRPP